MRIVKPKRLVYAYRAITGLQMVTSDTYKGSRSQAIAHVRAAFKDSITPLVWVGEPKKPIKLSH